MSHYSCRLSLNGVLPILLSRLEALLGSRCVGSELRWLWAGLGFRVLAVAGFRPMLHSVALLGLSVYVFFSPVVTSVAHYADG